jgi:hypothetical protein
VATVFKNYLTPNVGTATSVVITGGAAQTTVYSMTIANTTGSTISVTIRLNSGVTTCIMCKNAPIPAGGSLVAIGEPQKVALESGDTIDVESSALSSADVIVSTVEIS